MRLQAITVGIVIYKTEARDLNPLFSVLREHKLVSSWVVVDNGSSDEIRDTVARMGGTYIRPGKNIGFGSGHNLALKSLDSLTCPYHLILNPDIMFDGSVLEGLIRVMESHPEVGLLMPKVVYPDGRSDLALRRFLPGRLSHLAKKRTAIYELHDLDYDSPAYVPSLSGCFMLIRKSVFKAVGGFDERFFLYMEDVDLCRRMSIVSKLLYWPGVTVKHVHQMGSYRDRKLLLLHIKSAIQYFNKWGWIVDGYRRRVNGITLVQIERHEQ
jgi:GT2 family glycosyltransferase